MLFLTFCFCLIGISLYSKRALCGVRGLGIKPRGNRFPSPSVWGRRGVHPIDSSSPCSSYTDGAPRRACRGLFRAAALAASGRLRGELMHVRTLPPLQPFFARPRHATVREEAGGERRSSASYAFSAVARERSAARRNIPLPDGCEPGTYCATPNVNQSKCYRLRPAPKPTSKTPNH